MTIDDAAMDELDLAIRREASVLREQVVSSAETDLAWADFLGARSTTITRHDRTATVARHRWRIAIAVGMVAALIATVVIIRQLLDNDATKLPIITPAPTTPVIADNGSAYGALVWRDDDSLVTVGPGADEQTIGAVPIEVAASIRNAAGPNVVGSPPGQLVMSVTGWVAASGNASEGFWFFNVHDSNDHGRFVPLAGRAGGHDSFGTWNPAGTVWAAVELDRTVALVDPATGDVTRLPSTNPPLGYPPTWTADGGGILAGPQLPGCFTAGGLDTSTLTIIPAEGGPETSRIPALDGEMNRIIFGPWMKGELCGLPPQDGAQHESSEVVVQDADGETTWIDAADVTSTSLVSTVFANTRKGLWALTERDTTRPAFDLHAVTSPHSVPVVNALDGVVRPGWTASIAAVAPDDSAVVVLVRTTGGQNHFHLVPTDGSPVTALDGEFKGFVARPAADDIGAPGAAYQAMVLRANSVLVAIGTEGRGRLFANVPPSTVGSSVHIEVSSTGWVAQSEAGSTSLTIYSLSDPIGTRRVVDDTTPTGEQPTEGRWSPSGNLFATVEGGTTLVIVHADTGIVTRLGSALGALGRKPTWTADSSGILGARPANRCIAEGDGSARVVAIIPVDGGPEQSSIPTLADGMNQVAAGGEWANDNTCGTSLVSETQPALSDIVVVGPTGAIGWIDATDVAPARLMQSVFAATRTELWVLARTDDSRSEVQLHLVTGPGAHRGVNALPTTLAADSTVSIVAVAPDDSSVVVLVESPDRQRDFYLLPTDGSPPTTLDGEFAGFVPTSLIKDLP